VVLCGVSPLIWRRLLVRNDGTIADLYATPPPRSGLDRRALELLFVIESRECGVANSVASAPRQPARGAAGRCRPPSRERFLYGEQLARISLVLVNDLRAVVGG
jgi:hypothetical protein